MRPALSLHPAKRRVASFLVPRTIGVICAVLVATPAAGCSSCEPGPPVPFGLDAGRHVMPAPERPAPPSNPERESGREFPDGTARVDLEGAPILVEGSIRALFAEDFDDDGDRDGILVVSGAPDAPISLLFAQRDGATFATPRTLAQAPAAPDGCEVSRASLSALGQSWLVARATLQCDESPQDAREEAWVLGTDRTPRVLEHLALLDASGRAPGAMTLAFAAEDEDDDGRADLTVTLGQADGGITLTWLDRPSGLARDAAEPERMLVERSRGALRSLRGNPATALAGSRRVMADWEALCRESGRARLRVGATDGLPCGRSDGAGRAATTIVRALGQQNDLSGALTALAAMDRDGLSINRERRDYARRAIAEAPASSGVTAREGPPHRVPAWDAPRLSAIAFLNENQVLLRGDRARVWDLSTGETTVDTESRGELRVLDPSGRWAVSAVVRRCEGHVLEIVAARSFVAGNAFGTPQSRPLLLARAAPSDANCPDLSPELAADDGGWTLLGWAPQGVVAAQGSTLRVVPLDLSAHPAGDARELRPGTPPPAPLPPGAASPVGRYVAQIQGLGVLVHRLSPTVSTEVFWPEGWAESDAAPSEPAVSPSGRRVAVLRGGSVWLLERSP